MPLTEQIIQTPRLELIAATIEHLDAELESHAALSRALGAAVPAEWPPGEYDRGAQEFFRARLAAGGPSLVGWLTWYALVRDASGARGALVAGAGFMGPPADGVVELGYSVLPGARGRGYAGEVVQALVAYAFERRVVEVIAHTSDENVASTRVLLGRGFRRCGPGPEAGSIEYRRTRDPGA